MKLFKTISSGVRLHGAVTKRDKDPLKTSIGTGEAYKSPVSRNKITLSESTSYCLIPKPLIAFALFEHLKKRELLLLTLFS